MNLSVSIPIDSFPTIGSSVQVELETGLLVTVQNVSAEVDEVLRSLRIPRTLGYVTVNTASRAADEIHAAINRRVNGRNRPDRFTLCDRKGLRMVMNLRHEPLTEVTCKQCRKMLVEDGLLDEV